MGTSLHERFNSKIEKTAGCWIWKAGRRKGYGQFLYLGRKRGAHQVSYELAFGQPPKGLDVCHSCDNPPCVNPAHLFLSNNAGNMRDASAKGRLPGQSQTRCIKGHPFTEANTRRHGYNGRECKTCSNARHRARRLVRNHTLA